MTRTIHFPWWATLLFSSARSAKLTDSGIEITSRQGTQAFNWHEIEQLPFKGRRLIGHTLVLRTAIGDVRLHFSRAHQRDEIWTLIARGWYLPRLSSIRARMLAFTNSLPKNGYVRSSQWTPIAQEFERLRSILPPEPPVYLLDEEQERFLRATIEFVRSPNAWLTQSRIRYVQNALSRHTHLFDTVESKPLTARQREACVVDEDNNLILAGAGSGKTSTVMGRVAFLVQSGQAKPEEILLLAYGRAAAAEMRERLEKRLGIKGITTATFHALGSTVVAVAEGKKASLSPMADDEKLKEKFIDLEFQRLQKEDPEYRQLILTYFERWLHPERNPFDFETLGDYYQFLNDNHVRTLKGEKVKGFGECDIANFLFKNGIEYRYEARFDTPEQAKARGAYHPDFFLPDHGIYIEHFGIDEQGNTAPYIDRQKYHDDMNWKRNVHKLAGTTLLETYHSQKQKGLLLDTLEKELTKAGVSLNPLPPESVLETLREIGAISAFSKILAKMLSLLKAANLSVEERENLGNKTPQLGAALKLLMPIFEAYQAELKDDVDFDDMVVKATTYVVEGKFSIPWKFIIVDEFQDIAKSRAQLVQALRKKKGNVSLFCVGDDWQSIYRFAGSDIGYTSSFREQFGATSTIELDKTFRFNSQIGEVASRFVTQNPRQLVKTVVSHEQVLAPTVSLMRTDVDPADTRLQIAERIVQIALPNSSVYFLARFSHDLPGKEELSQLKWRFPALQFLIDTIHGAKGKEADYVIVLGLTKGKYGLPSQIVTHPLIDALLPELELFPHAEERRLFYVALTRAKHRVYLPCDMRKCSPFVQELVKNEYPLDLEEFATSNQQRHALEVNCPNCKRGHLTERTNRSTGNKFVGCTNYPLCSHTEKSCSRCNAPMEKAGRFRQCVNAACGWWTPICPVSGGEMSYKTDFKYWGCSDYRSNDPGSCHHKEYGYIGAPPAKKSQQAL
ncbi:DNA helicase-4 [Pseudomonas sp. BIGb0408]|uniref:DNA 3'-5' helicase n=1 Tax=Phytopseudomonas flavescens TaxID=29435 RepID=A0A7Z0BMW7_9GAMM|nr:MULTISPECIES: UvrD-helicase domain-containing protein [Pseudomonas]MCW2293169.1 DNA helicase-4 [Pseudomonas sp. BIGb0408]NYH72260.1 DNA helicase-4 [Pseudomonas flavescens]